MSKYNRYKKRYLIFMNIVLIMALMIASIFTFTVVTTKRAVAATTTVPINMIQYGWHTEAVEVNILNIRPEFLVSTSAVGPWRGNADIGKLQAAGIKYFEYIDGGYEGTVWQPIPNDLQSNLNYINNIAAAGAYGVFVDEVSHSPSPTSLYYLAQIYERAHSLGLKVAFNCGSNSWSDSLMDYCDFMNSSEIWNNEPLTASQIKWASRTWLLTQNVYDPYTAATLTNSALSQGIRAHYACTSYTSQPYWLGGYVAQISYRSVATAPITFNSNPSGAEVWLDYSYQGVTPVTIEVAEGNHHIAFAREGYSTFEGDFIADGNAFAIGGDLLSRQFTSTGPQIVPSLQFPVTFNSNPSGAQLWLDYSYQGVTPMTIEVAEGNHHIAFAREGYSTFEGDFIADGTVFTISGDLPGGKISYNEPEDDMDNSESVSATAESDTDNDEAESATTENDTNEVTKDPVAGDDGEKGFAIYSGITKLPTLGVILVMEDLNHSLCVGDVLLNNP